MRSNHCNWGKVAWEGWWSEHGRVCARTERAFLDAEQGKAISGGLRELGEIDGTGRDPKGVEDVKFRFRRKGKGLMTWWKVVKRMEAKGWVTRFGDDEGRTRYVWVGNECVSDSATILEEGQQGKDLDWGTTLGKVDFGDIKLSKAVETDSLNPA